MNPLSLKLTVPADRKLTIQLPDDIEPGDETVVTVIVRSTGHRPQQDDASLDWFPTLNVSRWDSSISLRREDLYGDDGR